MQIPKPAETQDKNNILKMRMKLGGRPVFRLFFLFEVRLLNDILFVLRFFVFFLLIAIVRYIIKRIYSQIHAWRLMRGECAALIIFVHNSFIESPVFAAAIGNNEWVVKPGMVLTSSA